MTMPIETEQLLANRSSTAVMKAGEMLLQPRAALSLVNELERAGTLILGVDVWYDADGEIAQSLSSLDLSESRDMCRNATQAKSFIESDLPEGTAFVSLVYDESTTHERNSA